MFDNMPTIVNGSYKNGVIVLDDNVRLNEGQKVRIYVPSTNAEKQSFKDRFYKHLGSLHTFDSKEEIDEYLKECRSE